MVDDIRRDVWKILGSVALFALICLGIMVAGIAIAGCKASAQGHTTLTAVLTGIGAAVTAFFLAPLEFLIAMGAALAMTLAILAFSPKYPIDTSEPSARTHTEKPLLDKTLYEAIFQ